MNDILYLMSTNPASPLHGFFRVSGLVDFEPYSNNIGYTLTRGSNDEPVELSEADIGVVFYVPEMVDGQIVDEFTSKSPSD
jgi:hypothetical protein